MDSLFVIILNFYLNKFKKNSINEIRSSAIAFYMFIGIILPFISSFIILDFFCISKLPYKWAQNITSSVIAFSFLIVVLETKRIFLKVDYLKNKNISNKGFKAIIFLFLGYSLFVSSILFVIWYNTNY